VPSGGQRSARRSSCPPRADAEYSSLLVSKVSVNGEADGLLPAVQARNRPMARPVEAYGVHGPPRGAALQVDECWGFYRSIRRSRHLGIAVPLAHPVRAMCGSVVQPGPAVCALTSPAFVSALPGAGAHTDEMRLESRDPR